jgi:hypothetical protein
MKRLATVSVVKGRELGEAERMRAGQAGAGGRELVEDERDMGVPSERRSLPSGS